MEQNADGGKCSACSGREVVMSRINFMESSVKPCSRGGGDYDARGRRRR
jgi:excinuclease UvrABC ATPase subunit